MISSVVILLWASVSGLNLCIIRVYKAIETYLGVLSCGQVNDQPYILVG